MTPAAASNDKPVHKRMALLPAVRERSRRELADPARIHYQRVSLFYGGEYSLSQASAVRIALLGAARRGGRHP